jgi:hypothetical protein
MVYAAKPTALCEIPFPAAIALTVVVAEIGIEHGFEHEVDDVVGIDPLVV